MSHSLSTPSIPLPAAPADLARRPIELASLLLYAPLFSATLLAKVSVPPFSQLGLGIAFLFIFLAVGLGMLLGRMRFEGRRTALFLLLIGFFGSLLAVRGEPFSFSSLALLIALHAAYMFQIPRAGDNTGRALATFLDLAGFLAWCGIAQFFLQFVVPAEWVFPIENFLPAAFRVELFNSQGPLSYGSSIYRANGVFLLEPSFFSQLLAVAIVTELCTRNRLSRFPLYGLALLVSYSGTGLMVLALCLPLMVILWQRWDLLLVGALALLLLMAFGEALNLDLFAKRANEFGATGSSAFARFVGGFYLFDQFLWHDTWRTLFGFGPGTYKFYAAQALYPASEMPLFKMVLEFGLVGSALYFGFLYYCVFASAAPPLVRLAIGMTFLLNGNYVPFMHGLALSLLVWTSPAAPAPGGRDPNTVFAHS
ncbi:hypothetical protein [Candidatus Methylocalor cossyra]|uniref:Polymerase n=1 Tax=Candidatus Methylocalor cossyra TaxID=3108543 RepID=A0ABP1CC11_9GAMM